jgi:predicted TIM-barrel fold metal-dependent hydrolase
MTTTGTEHVSRGSSRDESLVVVSSDTHVSPTLEGDLRPLCPAGHLQDFDDWMDRTVAIRAASEKGFVFGGDEGLPEVLKIHTWNLQTQGQRDVHARLRDLDRDGVAAEIIFHGSAPYSPIPFLEAGVGVGMHDAALAAVGQRMYNRWLADFCSVEPERHVGLAHIPMWDPDAAVRELEWAHEAGLKAVNFPAQRAEFVPYEAPVWEPFWSACEALEMPLATHGGGGGSTPPTAGPTGLYIYIAESGMFSRISPFVRLAFGGVLERHPGLKLIQTEAVGDWYDRVLADLDSIWEKFWYGFPSSLVPRRPSEYARESYFVGASFQSHAEAEAAVRAGYSDNVIWGSDYPHPEGTYHYQEDPGDTPITRLAMRTTFAGLPDAPVRNMLGENGVRVYGLDGDALRRVAERIGAPTLNELAQPPAEPPAHWGFAFRSTTSYA